MSDLLGVLGYAVFERLGDGLYRLEGEGPEWIRPLLQDQPESPIADIFPFLEVFLPDAVLFWQFPGPRSTLRSDFWTQGDQHLCATATIKHGPRLLIESAEQRFHETQELVHYARTKRHSPWRRDREASRSAPRKRPRKPRASSWRV